MPNNELMHHGVKGQKWGIRRFQMRSGKLTILGKKHRAGASDGNTSNKKKSNKKKLAKGKSSTAPKQKSVKDMTDEEIIKKINRARLERDYNSLFAEPQKKKMIDGHKLISDFANKVIIDPGLQAASNYVRKSLDKAVESKFKEKEESISKLKKISPDKLSDKDLKRVVDRMDLESRYAKNKESDSRETIKKTASQMTDAELKKAVERLNTEKKYTDLKSGKSVSDVDLEEIIRKVEERMKEEE